MLKRLRNTNMAWKRPAKDIWHVGVIRQPIADFIVANSLGSAEVIWLPQPGKFRFIADPFGMNHDGKFTVLVEALDYRVKRGEIHYYTYDAQWNLIAKGLALKAPFHLSYPLLIREGDAIYMLPEAHKSGRLMLYQAVRFPDQWQPVATLLNVPAIDASVVRFADRWWMFYALPGKNKRALRELHVAYADTLAGPWLVHQQNPVRDAIHSARPGGLPFVHEGVLYVPTQDCVNDYGAAINLLRIDTLTPNDFSASIINRLSADDIPSPYQAGLHTLSGDGAITLIDVKRIDRSYQYYLINAQRRLRRWLWMSNSLS